MKKLLCLLLLLTSQAWGQTESTRVRDFYPYITGQPTFSPSTSPAYGIDLTHRVVYKWLKYQGWKVETDTLIQGWLLGGGQPGPQGPAGQDGAPGICPPCPGGGGGGNQINQYLSIESDHIAITGSNGMQTLSQAGINPSVYAGITVSSSDLVDWCNLTYAIYVTKATRLNWIQSGVFKGINKKVTLPWDLYTWNTLGDAKIETSTSTALTVFDREDMDASNWTYMISNTRWHISGWEFNLKSNQQAFDFQAQNNSQIEGIKVLGAALAIKGNFWINTTCERINIGNCIGGIYLNNGEFTGAGETSTGNVMNKFLNIHASSVTNTCEYVIRVRFGEGTVIRDFIAEGAHINKPIWLFNGFNGNFRSAHLSNLYFEYCHSSVGPCTTVGQGEAAIVLDSWSSGTVEIDGFVKSIYPAMLLDVYSVGYFAVHVSNVVWWPAINGKLVYTNPSSLGIRYQFENWSHDYIASYATNPLSIFAGKTITLGDCSSKSGFQSINTLCIK